jgi:hypothetical protein
VIQDRSVIGVDPDPEVLILAFLFINASLVRSYCRAKLKIGNGVRMNALQGAGISRSWTFHDMEVDHGGGDVGMAEKASDGTDVGAGLSKCVANEWPLPRIPDRFLQRPLDHILLAHGVAALGDRAPGETTGERDDKDHPNGGSQQGLHVGMGLY